MNMSQSEELRYFALHYGSNCYQKQWLNDDQFKCIFHRNYRLGLVEMAFQNIKYSKFSGEACTQIPLDKYRFSVHVSLGMIVK